MAIVIAGTLRNPPPTPSIPERTPATRATPPPPRRGRPRSGPSPSPARRSRPPRGAWALPSRACVLPSLPLPAPVSRSRFERSIRRAVTTMSAAKRSESARCETWTARTPPDDSPDRRRGLERHSEAHVGEPAPDVDATGRGRGRDHRDERRGDGDFEIDVEEERDGGDDEHAAADPDHRAEQPRPRPHRDQGQDRQQRRGACARVRITPSEHAGSTTHSPSLSARAHGTDG